MKVGIMQPYMFPYIGYFQLINAVDKFVIHDDAQFIKGGWINRNRVLSNNAEYLFTFGLTKASSFENINQRFFYENFYRERRKFLSLLKASYGRAPSFHDVMPVIEAAFDVSVEHTDISTIITRSLRLICDLLNITTQFIVSSQMDKNNALKGEQRVIEINKCLNANTYINPIGGVRLYSKEEFRKSGLKLQFLESDFIKYEQGKIQFVPWLSIIDVLMFNSTVEVQEYLQAYKLM